MAGVSLKRLILAVLAMALLVPSAAEATTVSIPVKDCGYSRTGWQVTAGLETNLRGDTPCRFAWSTYRKVRATEDRVGNLPWHFRVMVGRYGLRCKVVPARRTWDIRCKNQRFFVAFLHLR